MNGGDDLEVQCKDPTSCVAQGATAARRGGEGCGPGVRDIGGKRQFSHISPSSRRVAMVDTRRYHHAENTGRVGEDRGEL